MEWDDFRSLLRGRSMPLALVDLDALDRNVAAIVSTVRGADKTIRLASKSVRHEGLLRRILEAGAPTLRGLMCYSAREAAWLASRGVCDDLFVAYPTVDASALDAAAREVARGARVRFAVDAREHLDALDAAGQRAKVRLEAVVDVDVSYRPFGDRVHVGVRRSPLRDAAEVGRLARLARSLEHARITGLMGYEAHVAGLPDRSPGGPPALAIRALKRAAMPAAIAMRAASHAALLAEGASIDLVNGGGTGSLRATAADPIVTELTAGSGFVCSHLFDGYDSIALEPAAFFALEVARVPDRDHITCAMGGYIASGAPGRDRLPVPHRPRGLRYVDLEGAGEVQTPLIVRDAERAPRIGDPVVFRHAKAGELAERFEQYLLVRRGEIVATEPTYRGTGVCFG